MTDDFDLSIWIDILDNSLQRLAAGSSAQIAYLVQKGVAPIADELGLEFDTGWRPVEFPLEELPGTQHVLASLREVDAVLNSDNLDWDVDALRESSTWADVRQAASRAQRQLADWRSASSLASHVDR